MEIKAKTNNFRMSPRKVRLVVDVVRGLKVDDALNQLAFVNKKATVTIKKLIDSAIANAENNYSLKRDNLFIKEIKVNEGRTIKRWKPRARGRATTIRKRTSHILIVLGELVDSGEVAPKKIEVEEPVKLGKKDKQAEGVKTKSSKKDTKTDNLEKGKKIVDPRSEGKGKNTKIEGKASGVKSKMFRRKSG